MKAKQATTGPTALEAGQGAQWVSDLWSPQVSQEYEPAGSTLLQCNCHFWAKKLNQEGERMQTGMD